MWQERALIQGNYVSSLEVSQLLGNYGEFVGAITIVVTLVYLAIQVKQNTKSVQAAAYQSWVEANVQINQSLANSLTPILLEANRDSKALTEESAGAYAMLHLGMLQMAQAVDYLYRSGSMDEELWESEMNRAALIVSVPGVRQLWEAGLKTQLTPSFVARLESIRAEIAYVDWDPERGFYHNEELSKKLS